MFSFQPELGFLANVLGEAQSLKEALQELVADVETMRMTMGMQGEGIAMALLMKSEIWQEATTAVQHLADGSAARVKIEE